MSEEILQKILLANHAKLFVKKLQNHQDKFRFVGGAVRNSVLGRSINDVDIASQNSCEENIKLLNSLGIKTIPTGIDHGTITALIDGKEIEITTLRSDIKTDGRKAEVEYSKDWKLDSNRRDFTINALYLDFNGKIYDYHNGLGDLRSKILRFIGDPENRIKEDHLRILRLFRFYAELDNFNFDVASLKAATQHKKLILKLSRERIRNELWKLFAGKNCIQALSLLEDHQILEQILPVIKDKIIALKNHQNSISTLQKITYFLDDENKSSNLTQLKKYFLLSRKEEIKVKYFLNMSHEIAFDNQVALKEIIRKHGREIVMQMLSYQTLWQKDLSGKQSKITKFIQTWPIPEFPVSGKDLIKLGYKSGKDMGYLLNKLELIWQESDYQLTKQQLLAQSSN